MRLVINKSRLSGSVEIPGSKSHTIRATAIASLADGRSTIRKPLTASDTLAAVNAYSLFGADITRLDDCWNVCGIGGCPNIPENIIDVGNSGTTLYIALGSAALIDGISVLTGDDQIRCRPAQPLIDALNKLGATVESTRANGMAPIIVRGPMRGGEIILDGSKTSQYLTSLLINCPLVRQDTMIRVRNLIEKPYIEMTLRWLEEQRIEIENRDFVEFRIPGGQSYKAFDKTIPADWSSATFFMCAAAITKSELEILGLDINDTQGDRTVAEMLREMGAKVEPIIPEDISPNSDLQTQPSRMEGCVGLRIVGGDLNGAEFDLSDTPDALPALAITACFAEGETRLVNVPQARLKETDRISVMREELTKMGADVEELPDGLVIRGRHSESSGRLHAAELNWHHDHRVIMALAIAGLAVDGETSINTAEALSVTFPTFVELMRSVGAEMRMEQ